MFKNIKSNTYIFYILLHIAIGFTATIAPFITKIITLLIVVVGVTVILKNKDKNNEALFFAAYVCGIEVFLRMTSGMIFNEFGKYAISLFCFLGLLFHPVRSDKLLFLILALLLLPGVFIGLINSDFSIELRKTMMFNLSGEFCLLVCCLYTINLKVSYEQLIKLIYTIGLPIICITTYVIFRNIGKEIILNSTGSNFETSGGFGPNQVSTILGLGTFCFFALFLLKKSTRAEKIMYLVLFIITTYRGIITFSRGGMICAGVMIVALLAYIFLFSNNKTKIRIISFSIIGIFGLIALWMYTSFTTDGLIGKRYSNEDALGRKKESVLSGREEIMESELDMFLNNPLFGVGVGRTREVRIEDTGLNAANHNEATRLLAEHGSLGIIYFIVLICLPLFLWLNNRQHILLIPFFIFWVLTINHAAMRTAAPAFIFSLCLLKIYIPTNKNEDSISRQSITA